MWHQKWSFAWQCCQPWSSTSIWSDYIMYGILHWPIRMCSWLLSMSISTRISTTTVTHGWATTLRRLPGHNVCVRASNCPLFWTSAVFRWHWQGPVLPKRYIKRHRCSAICGIPYFVPGDLILESAFGPSSFSPSNLNIAIIPSSASMLHQVDNDLTWVPSHCSSDCA